ncbi:MAG: YggT family protein [Candidatus Aminicenantes bacterium]
MILFANFLGAVAGVLRFVLNFYMLIVIFRVILSWVNVPSLRPLVIILHNLTEPVLRPFRRLIPPRALGGIDISPVIVILLIYFVNSAIVRSLSIYADQLLKQHTLYF